MLQWPYCSACRNGTIPQHNSLSSSISSHTLITKALSHSLLHIYSCVWVPVRVCVSFTSTSVHTHILSTSRKTCQKLHPSHRNPHVTSFTNLKWWNGTVMVISSYDDVYHGIHLIFTFYSKVFQKNIMLLPRMLSCKCLNSSFYCCSIWPGNDVSERSKNSLGLVLSVMCGNKSFIPWLEFNKVLL